MPVLTDADSLRKGTTKIDRIYAGSTLAWQKFKWLVPTIGTASTPDDPAFQITTDIVMTAKVRIPTVNTGVVRYIACQRPNASNDLGWQMALNVSGSMQFLASITGSANTTTNPLGAPPTTVEGEWILLQGYLLRNNGNGQHSYRGFYSRNDGVDFPTLPNSPQNVAGVFGTGFNSTRPVSIGNLAGGSLFPGEIAWVEMRTGVDWQAGTRIFRFDASDYPGSGTTFVSGGRTWTLTNGTCIKPA